MRLKNGENHLTQWDRHQILVFSEYPAGTEIHMWCDFFDNALKFELDSNREVVVPDILLQTSGMLRICVYVTNEYSTSYTEVRYLIPVKARPRPEDYVYTPEETKLWERKLDKNLGENNAGKILTVDKNGDVTAVEMPVIDGPGENNISLGLSSATVGDIIKVKAVDDNGTPTAWESAAMPDNSKENWVTLGEYDMSLAENQVARIYITKYNGSAFRFKKLAVIFNNVVFTKGFSVWSFQNDMRVSISATANTGCYAFVLAEPHAEFNACFIRAYSGTNADLHYRTWGSESVEMIYRFMYNSVQLIFNATQNSGTVTVKAVLE